MRSLSLVWLLYHQPTTISYISGTLLHTVFSQYPWYFSQAPSPHNYIWYGFRDGGGAAFVMSPKHSPQVVVCPARRSVQRIHRLWMILLVLQFAVQLVYHSIYFVAE